MKKEDADQLIRCVRECWWRVLLLLTIPSSVIAWAIYGWPIAVAVGDGVAAWVQAFGSIGAILGAFAVAERQAKLSLDQTKEIAKVNAARKQAAYKSVVEVAYDYAKSTGELVSKKPPAPVLNIYWQTMGDENTRAAVEALVSIPLHDLGDAQLVIAANGLRGALVGMRAKIQALVLETDANANSYASIQGEIELQLKLALHYWQEYEKAYDSQCATKTPDA